MHRKECNDIDQVKYLDKVNNDRLETTCKRVAHAIRILMPATFCTYASDKQKSALKDDIAHATNLLDAGVEELRFHCEWFGYDTSVALVIDDACCSLGQAMAEMLEDNYDIDEVTADVKDACVLLAKALAALIRWNDETADESEV